MDLDFDQPVSLTERWNQMRSQVARNMVLPHLRFFTAKPKFFEVLKSSKGIRYIEAGCGVGHTTHEANAQGIAMLGIDLSEREGQLEGILPLDAVNFAYNETIWPVICRPNHNGWAEDCITAALKKGASAFYVSKPSNVHQDLGPLMRKIIRKWAKVGEEGETMYLIQEVET